MSQIDTVRPDSSPGAAIWIITDSTVEGATSDDSDATFITSDNEMIQAAGYNHSLPAGFERHKARLRIRGSCVGDDQPTLGATIFAGLDVDIPTLPNFLTWGHIFLPSASGIIERIGPWYYQEDDFGSNFGDRAVWEIFSGMYVRYDPSNENNMNVMELYLDIDNRLPPSFTPDVEDSNGISVAGGVSASPIIRLVFGSIDYDALAARSWQVTIVDALSEVTVFETSGAGQPPANITSDILENGSYEAVFQAFSTIRSDDAYASAIETVAFDVFAVPPDPPLATAAVIADPPSVDVCWQVDSSPGSPASPASPGGSP